MYRPVDASLNISRIGNVKDWFPNLAAVARLDDQEPLPFMHDVYRAKIMWTVVFNGVIGEASGIRREVLKRQQLGVGKSDIHILWVSLLLLWWG